MKKLKVDLPQDKYSIIIKKSLIKEIPIYISRIHKNKKIVIITDENVNRLYGQKLVNILKEHNYKVKKIVIQPGEKSKSLETLRNIYSEILKHAITREDLIITFGGGVVGDVGGFAASTLLRGIPYIQIPTTLLSQIDSSVGGKVAVNLPEGKNLAGSFYHPKIVLIDPQLLKTLDKRFLYDGFGEVIKYGCIRNKKLFERMLLYKTEESIFNNIEDIIYSCCKIKRDIVQNDEKDKGERMLLNFGHTLGHIIEKYYNYNKFTHGEAVAIGMYTITKKSEKLGITNKGVSEKIKNINIAYNLPYKMPKIDSEIIDKIIKFDKKNKGDTLNLVLLKDIGKASIYKFNKQKVHKFLRGV